MFFQKEKSRDKVVTIKVLSMFKLFTFYPDTVHLIFIPPPPS